MLYYYCKNKKGVVIYIVLLCFLSKILRKAYIGHLSSSTAIEEMLGMNIIKKRYFINYIVLNVLNVKCVKCVKCGKQ